MEKTCKTCGETKPIEDFHRRVVKGKPYTVGSCKRCVNRAEKVRRAAQTPEQKAASDARKKAWEARNADRSKQNKAAWYAANRDRHALLVRNRRLITSYGLTVEDYSAMLDSQGGGCAACGTQDPGTKYGVFHVDHDHTTGQVRALLCSGCNVALGAVNDSIPRMLALVDYLRAHQEGQ